MLKKRKEISNMIEKIRDYFKKNVTLAEEFDNILVDFLGEDATSYSIEPIPVEPKLKSYSDGGSLNQYVFQFGSREFYDNSVAQNINNLGFYERFQEEIETNNKNGVLPDVKGIRGKYWDKKMISAEKELIIKEVEAYAKKTKGNK